MPGLLLASGMGKSWLAGPNPLVRALSETCALILSSGPRICNCGTIPHVMNTVPRRAVIYCRISMDRTGAGLGVDRQEQDCRRLAEQLQLDVVKVISDNDMSAFRGKRKGYAELLELLDAKAIDVVVSWHSDRLHRSPAELETFIRKVEQAVVAVHFVQSGPVDLASPAGRLSARIAGAVASHESEHKAARVSAARKQQAQQGRYGGGPRPFGFDRDGVTVVPAEADVIRRAFDLILHGGSIRSVVRMLNREGFRTTREHNEWDTTSTRLMMLRPRNAGLAIHQRKIIGPGDWPEIVAREVFEAVEEILTDKHNRARTGRGTKPRWLGSQIYVCGVCQETMRVGTTGNPPRSSYLCRSTLRGGVNHVSRSAVALDTWVTERLLSELEKPEAAVKFAPEPRPSVDVAGVRRGIAMLEEQGRRMSARLAQGVVTDDEFDAFIPENRARIRELESQLASAIVVTPASDLVATGDVRGTWELYELDQKRAVLRDVVAVTVLPTGVRGGRFDPAFVDTFWRE